MQRRRSVVAWSFCLGNVAIAGILSWAVFGGLPVRWWVVDAPTVLLVLLLLAAAAELALGRAGLRLLRASAFVGLALGLCAVAALSLSAAYLSGTHGALGQSGALTLMLVLALVVPYLIFYPSAQLLWAHRQLHGAVAAPG
jgi:hypothetical protein